MAVRDIHTICLNVAALRILVQLDLLNINNKKKKVLCQLKTVLPRKNTKHMGQKAVVGTIYKFLTYFPYLLI